MLHKNLVEGNRVSKVTKGHNPQHPRLSCMGQVFIFTDAAFSKENGGKMSLPS